MSKYQRQKQSSTSSSGSSSSTTTMTDSTETYPIIRRRISKACNYCRQRKIKCNGTSPCLNCKNHHIECTYSKTIRKKKKTTTKKLTLQDLEKRVNKMDAKFDLLNDKVGMILELLAKNGIKQHSNEKESSNNKIKEEEASELVSSDEEYEEDQEEDQEEHILSPLSEYSNSSNSESILSNEQPEEFNQQDNNDDQQQQIYQKDLYPNVNYSLDQQVGASSGFNEGQTQFDLIGMNNINNMNIGFKEINYLYDSNQLMSTNLDSNDVF